MEFTIVGAIMDTRTREAISMKQVGRTGVENRKKITFFYLLI